MVSGELSSRKEGKTELTPAIIESAVLEIIQNADEILEMYNIEGAVINVSLGLIPKSPILRSKEATSVEDYELRFTESDRFGFAVSYSEPGLHEE